MLVKGRRQPYTSSLGASLNLTGHPVARYSELDSGRPLRCSIHASWPSLLNSTLSTEYHAFCPLCCTALQHATEQNAGATLRYERRFLLMASTSVENPRSVCFPADQAACNYQHLHHASSQVVARSRSYCALPVHSTTLVRAQRCAISTGTPTTSTALCTCQWHPLHSRTASFLPYAAALLPPTTTLRQD